MHLRVSIVLTVLSDRDGPWGVWWLNEAGWRTSRSHLGQFLSVAILLFINEES